MKLHFGFESISYSGMAQTKGGRFKHAGYGQGKTSKQVAEELEEKYKIVQTFYNMEEDFIVSLVEDTVGEDLEEVMMMSRITRKKAISDVNTDKIASRFRRNIAERRYDGVISGVPTLASLKGVSHLRQHPYASRGSRPSFRDTGNYVNSFRVWTEED